MLFSKENTVIINATFKDILVLYLVSCVIYVANKIC